MRRMKGSCRVTQRGAGQKSLGTPQPSPAGAAGRTCLCCSSLWRQGWAERQHRIPNVPCRKLTTSTTLHFKERKYFFYYRHSTGTGTAWELLSSTGHSKPTQTSFLTEVAGLVCFSVRWIILCPLGLIPASFCRKTSYHLSSANCLITSHWCQQQQGLVTSSLCPRTPQICPFAATPRSHRSVFAGPWYISAIRTPSNTIHGDSLGYTTNHNRFPAGGGCDRSCLIRNLRVGKFRSPLKHKVAFSVFFVLFVSFYPSLHYSFQGLMKLKKERKENETQTLIGVPSAHTVSINCPVSCCNWAQKSSPSAKLQILEALWVKWS